MIPSREAKVWKKKREDKNNEKKHHPTIESLSSLSKLPSFDLFISGCRGTPFPFHQSINANVTPNAPTKHPITTNPFPPATAPNRGPALEVADADDVVAFADDDVVPVVDAVLRVDVLVRRLIDVCETAGVVLELAAAAALLI